MRGAWGRVFIEPFTQLKWWIVWKVEPWFEEQASLDLAWRVFARKHNAGGNRPICAYDGWEAQLDEDEKAMVYEFPGGDPGAPPNCLVEANKRAEVRALEESDPREAERKRRLNYTPGQVPR
jgi:hypothetical protein